MCTIEALRMEYLNSAAKIRQRHIELRRLLLRASGDEAIDLQRRMNVLSAERQDLAYILQFLSRYLSDA